MDIWICDGSVTWSRVNVEYEDDSVSVCCSGVIGTGSHCIEPSHVVYVDGGDEEI